MSKNVFEHCLELWFTRSFEIINQGFRIGDKRIKPSDGRLQAHDVL
ncbi:MAG: hypothetical protein ABL889_09465 [Terricaulis sp.]